MGKEFEKEYIYVYVSEVFSLECAGHGRKLDFPAAGIARGGLDGIAAERDGDFLTCVRRTPNADRYAALENRIVGEGFREFDFGKRLRRQGTDHGCGRKNGKQRPLGDFHKKISF